MDTQLGYTHAAVVDTHIVQLTDVTGAPLVPKRYGSTAVVVDTITLTYTRQQGRGAYPLASGEPTDGYRLTHVAVNGWRAKKDGAASVAQMGEDYYESCLRREPDRFDTEHSLCPEWLLDLGVRFAPRDDAETTLMTVGLASRTPGQTADLDALEATP
jgi:hypothetical protein